MDDLLIIVAIVVNVYEIRNMLKEIFELKEFREVQEFLGVLVVRNREKKQIFLHQKGFTERILEQFSYTNLRPIATPWNSSFKLLIE